MRGLLLCRAFFCSSFLCGEKNGRGKRRRCYRAVRAGCFRGAGCGDAGIGMRNLAVPGFLPIFTLCFGIGMAGCGDVIKNRFMENAKL